MTRFIQQLLADLDAHPQGERAAWQARYAPFISEHVVPAAKVAAKRAPKVSVVIVAFRLGDGLLECLHRVRAAASGAQVVVVANGPVPGLRRRLGRGLVDRLIQMKENLGPSPARNAGFAWTEGEVVAFLDDDGMIKSDYFERALAYFEDQNVLGIRGKILPRHHPYFTTLAGHYSRGEEVTQDLLITEGNCLVRAEAFLVAGGFADRRYGHEGVEMSWRLLGVRPGGVTLYAPDVVMAHDYVDGWGKFVTKETRYKRVDDTLATQDSQELREFMAAYFDSPFSTGPLGPDQQVARALLRRMSRGLKRVATWRAGADGVSRRLRFGGGGG